MTWFFNGKPFAAEDAESYVGFVYLITNQLNGRKYIGKKLFQFSRSKKVKGSTRRKHTKVVSDWETYYGSNKYLIADVQLHGPEHFKREILRLCKTKAECNYFELKEQMANDAILRDDYYNLWVSCKIHRFKIS
jgi:hypothetical protein